jgi:hypothetical protein
MLYGMNSDFLEILNKRILFHLILNWSMEKSIVKLKKIYIKKVRQMVKTVLKILIKCCKVRNFILII